MNGKVKWAVNFFYSWQMRHFSNEEKRRSVKKEVYFSTVFCLWRECSCGLFVVFFNFTNVWTTFNPSSPAFYPVLCEFSPISISFFSVISLFIPRSRSCWLFPIPYNFAQTLFMEQARSNAGISRLNGLFPRLDQVLGAVSRSYCFGGNNCCQLPSLSVTKNSAC